MSESIEDYKAFHEARRQKKQKNAKWSLEYLVQLQVPHKVLNKGNWHTLVYDRIDFWPSTGKWRERQTGKVGRGLASLVNYITGNDKII